MAFPALAILKSKTLYKYGIVVVVALALLAGAYFKGRDDVKDAWEAETATLNAKIKELESRGEIVTVKVETVVVEKIKTVKVKGDTITEYVYLTLPNDVGPVQPDDAATKYIYRLPKNFIALHDFAALGIVPANDDPTITDVSMSEEQLNAVLGVITQNYKTARMIEAQRDGWQTWYNEQRAVHKEVTER